MDWLLEKMFLYPRRAIAVSIVVIVVAGGLAWWLFVWRNPQFVFEDMLSRNLSTLSVTKTAAASNGAQSIDQTVRLLMGAANVSDWAVTAKQTGATVSTDSIGTPSTGYVRYTRIATSQTAAGDRAYNFGPVLNVWGRSDGKTDTSLDTLFAQTLLDIASAPTPPIANMTSNQRDTLLQFMRQEQVFVPDYSKTKTEMVNGRTVYTYQVAVRMAAYVRLMQGFAHDFKLTNVDNIDPSQYAALPPLTVVMSVDPSSHQLVKVVYAASGFAESYTDWGLQTPIAIPGQTITTSELQARLQSLSVAHS